MFIYIFIYFKFVFIFVSFLFSFLLQIPLERMRVDGGAEHAAPNGTL